MARVLVSLALLAGSPASAEDQSLSLDGLLNLKVSVSSATKTAQSLGAAPSTVRVITRQELDLLGYTTLGEALVGVPGLHVVDDHATAQIGVRGLHGGAGAWSRIVKILVDGRPVALPSEGGAMTGPEFMPLALVERIEVINGPGSALYGANAFLGVINVVTRDAARTGTAIGGGVNVGAGDWGGSGAGRFGVSLLDGRLTVSGGATVAQSDVGGAPFSAEMPREEPPKDVGRVLNKPISAFARVTGDLGAGGDLSASVLFQGLDADAPYAETGPLTDTHLDRRLVRGTVEHRLEGGEGARTLATYVSYTQGGTAPIDRLGTADGFVERERSGTGLELGTEGTLRWKQQTFLAGADFLKTDDSGDTLRDADDPAAEPRVGEPVEATNLGAFGQLMLNPTRWASITAGARADLNNLAGDRVSHRGAVVLSPLKMWHVKAMYGTSYTPPAATQRSSVPLALQGGIQGNPDLLPQTAETYEVASVVESADGHWMVEVVGFQSDVHARVEFLKKGNIQRAENTSDSTTRGAEVRGEWRSHLHYVGANLSVQRTVVDDPELTNFQWSLVYDDDIVGGRRSTMMPGVMASVQGGTRLLFAPLSVGGRVRYVGDRKPSFANITSAGESYLLPAYATLDLHVATARWTPFGDRESRASVHVTNLTNARFREGGPNDLEIMGSPRRLTVQIEQTF